MKYEECVEIIEQFQKTYAAVIMAQNVHGTQVILEDGKYVLQLVVTYKIDESNLSKDEIMPKSFNYTFSGEQKSIQTDVIKSEILRCHVRAGDQAIYDLKSGFGTAGWNVFFPLQNVWVCMSNWHVIVDPTDSDPIGNDVFLDGAHRGQLHAYKLDETWDYALASYNFSSDAEEKMRACADGTENPYPQQFAEEISIGEEYRKVGARTPICRTGRLRGVGSRKVEYNDGTIRQFHGQLIFEKMSDSGDSGAIIVRAHDNKITGLKFAGSDTDTTANPLYKIGWKYLGSIQLVGGGQIPMYDDSKSVVPTRRSQKASSISKLASPSNADFEEEIITVPGKAAMTEANITQAKEFLIGGKLYLGRAEKEEYFLSDYDRRRNNPTSSKWNIPIPPPIRNVDVDAVPINSYIISDGGSPGHERQTRTTFYLCFG
jgi:hypothetical protein